LELGLDFDILFGKVLILLEDIPKVLSLRRKAPGAWPGLSSFNSLFLLYQAGVGKYANFVTRILKGLRMFGGLTSGFAECLREK
jgi:hypothetical protein